MIKTILNQVKTMTAAMEAPAFLDSVRSVGELLQERCYAGHTIFTTGNGGSWDDADHFAGELRAQFEVKGRRALAALTLPISFSSLTAWGNDYDDGFITATTRDLEAMSKPGDVLFAISTSGKAKNIRQALTWAKKHDVVTIALSGNGPLSQEFGQLADHHIAIPASQTARVQEGYQIVIHMLCAMIDQEPPNG